MKISEMSGKNFARLKFIAFFTASVTLCIVILSSFWSSGQGAIPQNLKEPVLQDISGAEQLLEINQTLHSRWIELEQLYDEHSVLLAGANNDNKDVSAKQIAETESSYSRILDSVKANNSASPEVDKIDSIVNTYRASLQNKQALHTNIKEWGSRGISGEGGISLPVSKVSDQKVNEMHNTLLARNELIIKLQHEVNDAAAIRNNLTVNEQKLLQAQNDLQSKNEMIAKLQSQLSAVGSKATVVTNEQKVLQLKNEVETKNDLIAKLQQQLKSSPAKTAGVAPDSKKLNELQKELQSKTAMIVKLQNQVKDLPVKAANSASQSPADIKKMADELEFLKWALRSEVSSNHALTADVNKLKQANATLTTQLKTR